MIQFAQRSDAVDDVNDNNEDEGADDDDEAEDDRMNWKCGKRDSFMHIARAVGVGDCTIITSLCVCCNMNVKQIYYKLFV